MQKLQERLVSRLQSKVCCDAPSNSRCNSGGFWRLEHVFRLAADLGWEVLAGVVVVMGYPVDFCWYQLVIDLGGSGHLPVSLVAVVDGRLWTIVMVVSGVCRCGGRVY